jgi:diguanylate cyclase (GGDEF)-like protein/PAS domain S-box-containing protein
MFGLGPVEQPDEPVWRRLAPESFRDHFASVLRRVGRDGTAGGAGEAFEVEIRAGDGRSVPVEVSLAAAALESGRDVIGIFRDVTHRRDMQDRMALAARIMETAMEGVMVTTPRGIVEMVNPAFTELTGYAAAEAVGRSASFLKSGRHEEPFYAELWARITEQGRWTGEIWNRRSTGEVYPALLRITAIRDEQGAITHFVGVFSDITRLKLRETRLERLAHSDPLTGLPNRILLMDRLDQAVARARRRGESVAVYFLDLDGFKDINDRFGHLNGDRLLQAVGRRLMSLVREEDTVARLGGDEFVLMLRGLDSRELVEMLAVKLLRAVAGDPYPLKDRLARIHASVGVSRHPEDGDDPELLLQRADEAMYRAKASGPDQYRLHSG